MIFKNIYHIKRVEHNDFPAIKTLFWDVFKKKVSVHYLQQKYNTSYLGVNYICSIAYFNSVPVAFYGAIPQKFKTYNKDVLIAQACDSFTLKAHQRKGLHEALAKFSYRVMKLYHIKYVYAFHSKNTYMSTKKLHWKEYKHLQRFHIKVNTLPISKALNIINLNTFYQLFFNSKTPKNAVKYLNIEHPEKFKIEFNKQFIDYKNKLNTHYFFEAYGCIFWFKIQAVIHVGKFYAPNEIVFKKAIARFKLKAFCLGIPEILFQVDNQSNMYTYLKTIGTAKPSWLLGYLNFDENVNLNEYLFSYINIDTF